MARRAPLALLPLVLLLPSSGAQTVPQGEQVDILSTEFPPLAVADRPFYIDVTVQNRDSQEHSIFLFATLYGGASDTPCEGPRANQALSKFQKSVRLQGGERVVVEGEPSHWAQVVNGSRLPGDGSYEVCVWARLAQCPEGPVQACFLDHHAAQLPVRLANRVPVARLEAEPARGTTLTTFSFRAEAEDPDGDPLAYRWDFGDGKEARGARVSHRFAAAGSYRLVLNVTDGFDSAELEATVEVALPPPRGGGSGAPGPGAALAALAIAGVALTAAAARRPRR